MLFRITNFLVIFYLFSACAFRHYLNLSFSGFLYKAIERALAAKPEEPPKPILDADIYVKTRKRNAKWEYKLPPDAVVKKIVSNLSLVIIQRITYTTAEYYSLHLILIFCI